MHLAIVISSLAMGGAERVVTQLANAWAAKGVRVTVITLATPQSDFYQLDDSVRRLYLDLAGPSKNVAQAVWTNLRRFIAFRRAFTRLRPTAVISHLDATNILAILAATGLKTPVLVTEHTDLDEYREYLPLPWRLLRRTVYQRASAVVAVNRLVAGQLRRFLPSKKVKAIPNPVDRKACLGQAEIIVEVPAVASMGRLVKSKGFDLLLRAFARCSPLHPEWILLVLGDGPERNNLERLAEELGIAPKVVFAGAVSQPGPMLAQADVFALASRFEAFPMSLVEAMSCGLPVVCTRYPADPGEIVREGMDGFIVGLEDEEGFGDALGNLMADKELREEMGRNALQIADRYSMDAVLEQWNQVLAEATNPLA